MHISRASILYPSMTDFNLERLWHLYSGKSSRTVGEHLKRLGINPGLFRREIVRAGFSSETDKVKNGDVTMFRLLTMLYPFLLDALKEKHKIALAYIKQVAENSRDIGILDIGWVGNMQGSFGRILSSFRADCQLSGYYYGTFKDIHQNYGPRNSYQGYLVNECHPDDLFRALLSGGVELLEFAHMAPHGTTLGYEMVHGRVKPVIESNQEDQAIQQLSARVQSGAMHFIESAMPVILSIGYANFVSKDWSGPFFRLVNAPTREEAEYLGDITHSDSATDTKQRLALAPRTPRSLFGIKGRKFSAAYDASYWKAGFVARNRK
ncbi:hypothetical protein CCP4SC76_1480001 [Gammaproteobacteria bacterium]